MAKRKLRSQEGPLEPIERAFEKRIQKIFDDLVVEAAREAADWLAYGQTLGDDAYRRHYARLRKQAIAKVLAECRRLAQWYKTIGVPAKIADAMVADSVAKLTLEGVRPKGGVQ